MHFGFLRVIERTINNRHGKAMWLCYCESCGSQKSICGISLTNGSSRSCGCKRVEDARRRFSTHGYSETRVYRIWKAMRTRCTNPNSIAYARYGGRGIICCHRWADFNNFIADMGDPPTNRHTLDRIDNAGNYEPANCRWATPQQQADNSSRPMFLTLHGETNNIRGWAKKLGITPATLSERLERWSIEDALSTPKTNKWMRRISPK